MSSTPATPAAPARYNFRETEAKWQKAWEERETFRARMDKARPKYYVLEMFPYPSGRIHMGHVRNYTQGDVIARYKRARGFNVLHPMGWDAFGLPAENAAMEKKVHPKKWTYENIATMKTQLKSMGLSLDWSRELASCDPSYYRHQQKMFLDFWKAGLAYRKEAWVNWDPVDNTVLANEQVIEGKGWRTGAPVERRKLTQWNLKITHFADELLERLDTLHRWPDKVRLMQANWIGKSRGAQVVWQLTDASGADRGKLEIFTTRPDTLYGASFAALSAEHPLVAELADKDPGLQRFIAECRKTGTAAAEIETAEKIGYKLPLLAKHPLMPGKTLPVYAANFVLMEYGTGAIFGCPGHDERDHEFATKYGLPIIPVVMPEDADAKSFSVAAEPFVEDGVIINSDFLNGLTVEDAKIKVIERLEKMGVGKGTTQYRLRDWLVSRQRYWGCADPGHPLREVRPGAGAGEGPAGRAAGGRRVRPAGQSARSPSDLEARRLPDMRRAGTARDRHARHLHRFELVLRPLHLAATGNGAVRSRGARLLDAGRPVYRRRRARDPAPALFALLDARHARGADDQPRRAVRRPVHPGHGLPRDLSRRRRLLAAARGGRAHGRRQPSCASPTRRPVEVGRSEKMSKSKKNVVDPDQIIHDYGADTARWFMLSDSPPERDLEWTEAGVTGAWRFQQRLFRIASEALADLPAAGTPKPAVVLRGGDQPAPRRAQDDRRRLGRHRGLPLQQGGGAALRARQRHRRTEAQGRGRQMGQARGAGDLRAADRPDDAASGRGAVAGAGPQVAAGRFALAAGRGCAAGRRHGDGGGAAQRQAARHAAVAQGRAKDAAEKAALALPELARGLDGKTPKRVIVVPNRIVNVVV